MKTYHVWLNTYNGSNKAMTCRYQRKQDKTFTNQFMKFSFHSFMKLIYLTLKLQRDPS